MTDGNSYADKFRRAFQNPSTMGLAILFVLLIVNVALQPDFFTRDILTSNFMSFTPLIFAALAQGIIILSGSVDLSIGATMSLYTIIAAKSMTDTNVALIVALGLVITVMVGGFNGLLIGRLRLPPFIATFATSGVVLGSTILIMPSPGGYVPKFFYKAYRQAFLGIPTPLIILGCGLLLWFIVSRTAFYRHLYAVGGNEKAAFASGIKVNRVRLMSHLFAGVFVGLGGMCLLMLTASGEYRSGTAYSMNSIAAVVIGGIAMSGGRGNIWGAIVGALILGLLNNIIFFANVPSFYQNFFRGMIVIFSLTLGTLTRIKELKAPV
ncbi:MAG: ABC transporter permease [Spirochaetota bacterium]